MIAGVSGDTLYSVVTNYIICGEIFSVEQPRTWVSVWIKNESGLTLTSSHRQSHAHISGFPRD